MTFVALLRAVNVSGQNRVPMAELRALLEGLGLRDVRTYLQSGNVVFEAAGDATVADLATAIEARIERDMGPRVAVLVLSAGALAEVAGSGPFAGEPGVDEKWLHATFLFGTAGASGFDELALPAGEGEAAAFVGAPPLASPVIYLKLPHGYGRTKMTNAWFERELGVAATTRNWRTVKALVEMSAGEG